MLLRGELGPKGRELLGISAAAERTAHDTAPILPRARWSRFISQIPARRRRHSGKIIHRRTYAWSGDAELQR
jgi:hypothetical protein